MDNQTNFDAAIVGGGVIGCSIAWRLAQAGLSVTLVERGACGREASWAGAGIIDEGSFARTDPLARLRQASFACYEAFVGELRETTGIDPEFVRCGGMDLITDDNQDAAADREVRSAGDRRTAAGRPVVEKLTLDAARAIEPELGREVRGEVRSEVRGALRVAELAQVRNPRLMGALRGACSSAGVELRTHQPVTELRIEGSRVTGVRTPGGDIGAERVVLAAGAWSGQLSRLLQVRPVRGQIALLEMLPRPFSHVLLCGRNYLVPRLDGRMLVGTTEEEAGFDPRPTAAGVGRLLELARRFVPCLKDAAMLRAWAGLRPASPDGKPYLGPVPGMEGLFAASGHFRNGLTLAPITADLITQLLTTGRTEQDLAPFAPGRQFRA
jgi:glycine oxidase